MSNFSLLVTAPHLMPYVIHGDELEQDDPESAAQALALDNLIGPFMAIDWDEKKIYRFGLEAGQYKIENNAHVKLGYRTRPEQVSEVQRDREAEGRA